MATVNEANPIYNKDGYKIYELYSFEAFIYYLCMPDDNYDMYTIYLGFPKQEFEGANKDEIITELREAYGVISKSNSNGIYLVPAISRRELAEAALENDNNAYAKIKDELNSVTYAASHIISASNDCLLDQTITAVKQTDDDTKFIIWLETNYPSFVKGVRLENIMSPISLEGEEMMMTGTTDSGWTTYGGRSDVSLGNDHSVINTKNNHLAKKLAPPKSHGFSSMAFIVLVLMLSLILSVELAYYLIK